VVGSIRDKQIASEVCTPGEKIRERARRGKSQGRETEPRLRKEAGIDTVRAQGEGMRRDAM
jgi:hypothetical protein